MADAPAAAPAEEKKEGEGKFFFNLGIPNSSGFSRP